jgi:methylase of polypeptide subunit release factors
MSGEPYLASEDSAFLREVLQPYSGRSCLEIGAGNGGNLLDLRGRFDVVLGTDIILPTMADWKGGRTDYLLADAATCLRDGYFDLVIFNPPYLAVETAGDPTVEGGKNLEVPMKFLREALRVVRKSGKVVMLFGQDARVEKLKAECRRVGFGLRRLATRHLFFEELSAYEASAI